MYREQVETADAELLLLARKNNLFALYRLLTFGGFILICVAVLNYFSWYALIPFTIFLFVFRAVLRKHDKVKARIQYLTLLRGINALELQGLRGDHSGFSTGAEFINAAHPYTSDLDIFGANSLFQFLDRTTSKRSAALLASWLKEAAADSIIEDRQLAVKELDPMIRWRQNFQIRGQSHPGSAKELDSFFTWLAGGTDLQVGAVLARVIYVLPVLLLASLVYISFYYHPGVPVFILLVQIVLVRLYSDRAETLHQQISRFAAIILAYSGLIRSVEDETFQSPKLSALRAVITKTTGGKSASLSLKLLSGFLNKFDIREIPVFHVVLNYLFFWDLRQMIGLAAWKKANREFIPGWIDAISEFEVLCSLGNCSYNGPDWCFPSLTPAYFQLRARDAAHPLLLRSKRISNSLEIDGAGKVVLITGSNMSGKSTFLRTLGVNTVLAMTGAPVCAAEFTWSNCQVYTSLRVQDSLSEGASSFYAELKRLETLITMSRANKPVFFLLDEILRGTNSVDRYIGSQALIRQFIKNGTSGILASHDLGLADLNDTLPDMVNFSFDVQVEGTELFFDYTLHPGRCTSLNASILMKKIGIDLED